MQRRQGLQDRGVGAVGAGLPLLAAGQLQLLEQHVAQLLGRADIEFVPDIAPDRLLDLGDAAREIARQFGERVAIDLDPRILHRRDRRHHRPLDRLVERGHVLAHEPRLEQHMQPQRRVGALAGEIASPRGRDLGEADRVPPGAEDLLGRGQIVRRRPASSAPRSCARPARRRARRTSASCSHRARPRCRSGSSRCAMPFMSWPILRTPGSSSSGFSRASAASRRQARRSSLPFLRSADSQQSSSSRSSACCARCPSGT